MIDLLLGVGLIAVLATAYSVVVHGPRTPYVWLAVLASVVVVAAALIDGRRWYWGVAHGVAGTVLTAAVLFRPSRAGRA